MSSTMGGESKRPPRRVDAVDDPFEAGREGGGDRLLEFETLTLAPIDLACVDAGLLTDAERAWLNSYHARVRDIVGPQVDEPTRAWLAEATRAI